MGWSSISITAGELSYFNDDKPILLASHNLRDDSVDARWTTTGNPTDADQAASFARTERAFDGYAHPGLHTYPNANGTVWYLGAPITATDLETDTAIIHGSNLSLASSIALEISDNAAFTVNKQTIATPAVPAAEGRIVALVLDHLGGGARRYTGIPFVRLKINHATGFKPRVRELWLGRRRQMQQHRLRPVDDLHVRGMSARAESKSAVVTQGRHEHGGAVRDVDLDFAGNIETNVLRSFWDECNEGTESFYWIETPSSVPKAHLMRFEGEPVFNPVNIGNGVRAWSFRMREQNPFLSLEP